MDYNRATEFITKYRSFVDPTEEDDFLYEQALEYIFNIDSDPRVLLDLGYYYYEHKLFEAALSCFETVYALESNLAETSLGYIYYYGRTGEPDYALAYKYFSEGAEYGNISCLYKLADMYKYGYYVEKNYDEYKKRIKSIWNLIHNSHKPSLDYYLPDICPRMAEIYVKEGCIERAVSMYRFSLFTLTERISAGHFFGDFTIMRSLVTHLYQLTDFNPKAVELYDLYYLENTPCTLQFTACKEIRTIRVTNSGIEMDGAWYRDADDFLESATIQGALVSSLYFNTPMELTYGTD